MNKIALPFRLSSGHFFSYSALRHPSGGGDGAATGRFLIWQYQILDPNGEIVTLWNHIFLVSSIIALFIDPLYFFLPYIGTVCMSVDYKSGIVLTVWRTIADLFFLLHIVFKFRTAYVKPNSRVFGKGELVMDATQIAIRYLKTDFVVDLAASLPLPQFLIWVVLPSTNDSSDNANNTVALIVLIQYVPRLFQILPLNHKIVKNNGFIAKTAWAGAAYNLLLYILASHVSGAIWYLCSIARQQSCWKKYCSQEHAALLSCVPSFLDCRNDMLPERLYWLNVTTVPRNCDASKDDIDFKFGMFADAFTDDVASQRFFTKYLYCLWWGIKNLSSYGSNQDTTIYIGENLFCVVICIIGLILFSLLIGNMQTSLQSLTVRIEEWRLKRRDTEEWMRHRQLPPDLQERVHRFIQYKWLATRGVDEESILQSLPPDLRREIQRHLCLSLVRRVPFFSQMDDQLLDAICGRLVSSLSTEGTFIVREGDPVDEMLFIIRGQLESSTTNGGRSGFFNSITLRPGDFCGEELLTWALMPNSGLILPSSTRTVRALTEVEAFSLYAEDLTFVAHQFKRLQSKKLQHAFRYYSHQWRTWGACYIQTGWRRFRKKKMQRDLLMHENYYNMQTSDQEGSYSDDQGDGERTTTTQNLPGVDSSSSSLKMPKFFKPNEPDFSSEHEV